MKHEHLSHQLFQDGNLYFRMNFSNKIKIWPPSSPSPVPWLHSEYTIEAIYASQWSFNIHLFEFLDFLRHFCISIPPPSIFLTPPISRPIVCPLVLIFLRHILRFFPPLSHTIPSILRFVHRLGRYFTQWLATTMAGSNGGGDGGGIYGLENMWSTFLRIVSFFCSAVAIVAT